MKRITFLVLPALLLAAACSNHSTGSVPAAVSRVVVSGLSASTVAGTSQTATLTAVDSGGATVSTYAGTLHVALSDAAATQPANVAATSGVAHVTFTLVTAGPQTLIVTDAASSSITGSADQTVVAAAASGYAITLAPDVNAGAAAQASLTVHDAFGNLADAYAGTVQFSSTDSQATLPAAAVFNGSQHGHANVSVTFLSAGAQTLSAAENGNAAVHGQIGTSVHGLVYTDPSNAAQSAVAVVANPDFSNAAHVQLDVVAKKAVPAGFAIAMNLPVPAGQVRSAFIEGNVFDPGAAPKVEGAVMGTGAAAGALYSGLSQKAGGAGGGASDVAVSAGGIYYSIRLDLTAAATPGVVFDGSAAMQKFRAAVRDRLGNDTVGQAQFAVGKLEVR